MVSPKLNAGNATHLVEASALLASARNLIVICGAGISVTAGISTFSGVEEVGRETKELSRDNTGLSRGARVLSRATFDATQLRNPAGRKEFFTQCIRLRDAIQQAQPTKFHQLLRDLQDRGTLRRIYTQNIDNLEERAGCSMVPIGDRDISSDPKQLGCCVRLHGSLSLMRCQLCSHTVPTDDTHLRDCQVGTIFCPDCMGRQDRRSNGGKRRCGVGELTPAIVLYNEPNPFSELHASVMAIDLVRYPVPDALLVIGTSLKVEGAQRLCKDFARRIRSTFHTRLRVVYVGPKDLPKGLSQIFDAHIRLTADEFAVVLQANILNQGGASIN